MCPKIAYLTNQYPRASDTFIRTEIKYLRTQGLRVDTFAVRRPPAEALVSDEIRREHANTTYLRDASWLALVGVWLVRFVRHPLRMLATLRLSWSTGMPGISGRVRGLMYILEASQLANLLERAKIQHVHNHIGENSATVAMLASELTSIPYSLTIHGPGIFYHPRRWALGDKIQRSRFTAAITHFCRSQCMVFTPLAAWPKILVVRCCVDEAFLSQEAAPIPADRRLLFVGRLCEEKGVPLLVAAAARLKEAGQSFELNVIGDGPLRTEIEQMISQHQLQDCVHLLGFQSSSRVAEELQRSRALVLPSFAEGLPVVIMEALAMGRPVVTTRIAGIPELVNTDCGWLVSAGDLDMLANSLMECLECDTDSLNKMGQVGRQLVLQQHASSTALIPLRSAIEESLGS